MNSSDPNNIHQVVRPSSYLDYRLYFAGLYQERKAHIEGYSYQKFAEDLGFKPTTIMHQIVKGYRPLSSKALATVLPFLKLDRLESQYLQHLVIFGNAKNSLSREASFSRLKELKRELLPDVLEKESLDYFAEWYHPIVWELVGTEGFQPDPEWIAQRIIPSISAAQVEDSLALLLKLELIQVEGSGFCQTQNRITTGHRIKGMALVSYHQNMLDHAKNALNRISGKRRDVSSMTVSVTEEGAERLRAMIHAFQIQLLDEAERCEKSDQVYQINIQLFPFTE